MAKSHCMVVARDPTTGASLLSATCNVYTPGTVTPIPATMYDRNNNVLSNPLTSDAVTGLIDFYLNVAQEVDLVISKTGFTTRTYSNVPVLDDASNDLTALLTTTGDTAYASSANTPARLPIGVQGTFLNVGGGSVPRWGNTIDAGGLTVTAGGLTVTAGNASVGPSGPSTAVGLQVVGATLSTGGQQYGFLTTAVGSTAATSEIAGFVAQPASAAAAFTCAQIVGFHASTQTRGAGSTITSAYGVLVDAITVGGTNNYGVFVNPPSGAASKNIAIATFSPGFTVTADLMTNSDVFLGKGNAATTDTAGHMFITATSGAPTGVPTYDANGWKAMRWDTANNKLWVYSAGWKGVVLT